MSSPIRKLPTWVASFCCVVPFCALIIFAIAGIVGVQIGNSSLIALLLLCCKTTAWVLNVPNSRRAIVVAKRAS